MCMPPNIDYTYLQCWRKEANGGVKKILVGCFNIDRSDISSLWERRLIREVCSSYDPGIARWRRLPRKLARGMQANHCTIEAFVPGGSEDSHKHARPVTDNTV